MRVDGLGRGRAGCQREGANVLRGWARTRSAGDSDVRTAGDALVARAVDIDKRVVGIASTAANKIQRAAGGEIENLRHRNSADALELRDIAPARAGAALDIEVAPGAEGDLLCRACIDDDGRVVGATAAGHVHGATAVDDDGLVEATAGLGKRREIAAAARATQHIEATRTNRHCLAGARVNIRTETGTRSRAPDGHPACGDGLGAIGRNRRHRRIRSNGQDSTGRNAHRPTRSHAGVLHRDVAGAGSKRERRASLDQIGGEEWRHRKVAARLGDSDVAGTERDRVRQARRPNAHVRRADVVVDVGLEPQVRCGHPDAAGTGRKADAGFTIKTHRQRGKRVAGGTTIAVDGAAGIEDRAGRGGAGRQLGRVGTRAQRDRASGTGVRGERAAADVDIGE